MLMIENMVNFYKPKTVYNEWRFFLTVLTNQQVTVFR